jgi:hypothetical protein
MQFGDIWQLQAKFQTSKHLVGDLNPDHEDLTQVHVASNNVSTIMYKNHNMFMQYNNVITFTLHPNSKPNAHVLTCTLTLFLSFNI